MQSLADLGARIAFASVDAPSDRALDGLDLDALFPLGSDAERTQRSEVRLRFLQERFRSYWGIPLQRIEALGAAGRAFRADVVVVSGLDALPMLGGVVEPLRVWHAGDEWVLHHLSLVGPREPDSLLQLKQALTKGLYEFSYGSLVDRAWVVTRPDRLAIRAVMRLRHVDILPNGVDTKVFRPSGLAVTPLSAIFWGRLDFEPNVQAAEWFCREVWPRVRQQFPEATVTLAGYQPVARVAALSSIEGVVVRADVPDLKPLLEQHAIAVMPIVSGAGIKNKLLEAAAMARPVVCTPRAALGLVGNPPFEVAKTARAFAERMMHLWTNQDLAADLGRRARDWVATTHTWRSAARIALAGLEESTAARRGRTASTAAP